MAGTKKKHTKALVITLIIVGAVLITGLIVSVQLHLFTGLRMEIGASILQQGSAGLTYTEHHLTKEQMLADFEYLFRHACTDSLAAEQHLKYLKIDAAELHDTYKARIEKCNDEFDFLAVMASLMARLPGEHNLIYTPTDNLYYKLIFTLGTEMAYGGVREANYAYWKQFEDRMWSYTQKTAVVNYYAGDYVFISYDLGNGMIDDIVNGRLLTLNGEPAGTAVRKLDSYYPWSYDAENDCVRVKEIYFNDGIGDKYEAEIEMPDGRIVTKTLYSSAEYNLALYSRRSLYPDHFAKEEPAAGTAPAETAAPATSAAAQDTVKKSYVIVKDESRKLVYIRASDCYAEEADMIFNDITAALDETDAENIIVDVIYNGGGDFPFVTDGLCRAIFDQDVGWINYARFPKTDITDKFLESQRVIIPCPSEDMGDYIRDSEDFRAHGEAKKKYNIYVLISQATFSSGDIFAGIAAEQDNVTVLGENTRGEGFTGKPLNYYLPESKFTFAYTCSASEHLPEDGIVGTAPDIYCADTWEDYLTMLRMREDPDIGFDKFAQYEYRPLWSRPLREALKLIDSRS